MNNNNVNDAVSSFFSAGQDYENLNAKNLPKFTSNLSPANPPTNPPTNKGNNPPQVQQQPPPKKNSNDGGGIKSLSDYNKKEDERTNYYAGGERSGLAIQDPNEKKSEDFSDVFQSALKNGAISANEYKQPENKFSGSGFRLGNNPDQQSTYVPPKPDNGPVKKLLTFYKGGIFTIDNGPPRNRNDPQQRSFIEDINRGIVPRELEIENPGREVYVEFLDKKGEDYKEPPKPKIVAFSGSGQSLGNTDNNNNNNVVNTNTPQANEIVVDSSQPSTSIRVTCIDGSRLVVKANLTNTIGDLYAHVKAKKPGKNFQLKTTFPSTTLTDMNQTLGDAGLTNAAIVQFQI